MKDGSFISVHIRWMIRRDMAEVYKIERSSFEFPWSEDDFIQQLRRRDCIGMVAEYDERVVGFMLYELHTDRLNLISLAVCPNARRVGVGMQMIEKLVGKLSQNRRNKITLEVRETNLAAQLFLKRLGFKAVSVLRDFYDETPEDAYTMEYRFTPEAVEPAKNRIKRLV